ncbi:cell division protein FtsZ [Arundinibacter roseus]|uniref:Cell division protein FtsZ n=1 Tax=Arundinibacter roseus TaxID=2070510 RepID=A0A4R4K7S2_9BACT|nr:cell division protein FtsZ [Arundinibacter roseus]TDB63684.1 cell division protein FtsZ [Arundinibacter roseus]
MNTNLLNALEQDYIVNGIEDRVAEPSIIKVIGVGGGGSNAVNYMFEKKIKDVEFAICNTDRQALLKSPVPNKIQLGASLTMGLGAGMDITRGREAALETIEEIKALLGGSTQMVFITAGMGGGTGTGAAPVIAQIAKEEMKLLTVSVVTAPYSWEGSSKKEQALEGIEQLKKYSDTVLVVLNDKLEELFEDMAITDAFAQADGILLNAVKSISEIITTSGNINTDFRDVEKVLKEAGQSVMGTAEVDGDNRAHEAIRKALDSPLLNDREITGAQRILVTLASSKRREATMKEQREIWKYILSQVGGEAHLFKLGTIIDDTLGDKLRVTVVAAGFDSVEPPIPGVKARRPTAELPVEEPPIVVIDEVEPEEPKEEKVEIIEEEVKEEPTILPQNFPNKVNSTPTSDFTPSPYIEQQQTNYIPIIHEHKQFPLHYDDQRVPQDSMSGRLEREDWSAEEYSRIKELVERFRDKKRINWDELDKGPAYRRSQIDLWRKPAIPAHEIEQIRLD